MMTRHKFRHFKHQNFLMMILEGKKKHFVNDERMMIILKNLIKFRKATETLHCIYALEHRSRETRINLVFQFAPEKLGRSETSG